MPAPDPCGVWIDEHDDGRISLTAEVWPHGNRRNRIARMRRMLRRLAVREWRCEECGEPVPTYRRADARFCREACRKRMARRK